KLIAHKFKYNYSENIKKWCKVYKVHQVRQVLKFIKFPETSSGQVSDLSSFPDDVKLSCLSVCFMLNYAGC
ncbi:MAG TPA: hypothetical protein PK664_03910, partial [Paludibacteraceae bacterium]|nr:hypothetical protein [Paludibacteraceae bacterium]HPS10493.1 hypothetical protein [Paludibacteraceae bacterium]